MISLSLDESPNLPPQIIIPRYISRVFIQAHREWNFVYGADYYGKSILGQAWEAGGEPNAYPIPTLLKFCANPTYFQDADIAIQYMKEFMNRVPLDKPIVPFPKIGLGKSRFKEFCPKGYEFLRNWLFREQYLNIKIDYGD